MYLQSPDLDKVVNFWFITGYGILICIKKRNFPFQWKNFLLTLGVLHQTLVRRHTTTKPSTELAYLWPPNMQNSVIFSLWTKWIVNIHSGVGCLTSTSVFSFETWLLSSYMKTQFFISLLLLLCQLSSAQSICWEVLLYVDIPTNLAAFQLHTQHHVCFA